MNYRLNLDGVDAWLRKLQRHTSKFRIHFGVAPRDELANYHNIVADLVA